MATLAQIYDWFMTAKKPTQAQFWSSWGSFRHKDESIPQSDITNLTNVLNAKAETSQLAGKVDKVEGKSLLSDSEIERLLTLNNEGSSLKADLIDGQVPANQLPSYVDDVLDGQYISSTVFNNVPTGLPYVLEAGKIYVDTITNITYRWSGTVLIPIGSSLGLGETASTAFRGDRGAQCYNFVVSTLSSGLEFLVGQILKLKIAWFNGFTIAQRNAITSPQEGMLIYVNESPKGFQKYENGAWSQIGGNISNADLTNLTARTFTMNAGFTWATLGNSYKITGLVVSTSPDKALVLNAAKEVREVQIINFSENYTGATYPTNQFLLDTYPLAEIVKCPNTPEIREYHKIGNNWVHFTLTPAS